MNFLKTFIRRYESYRNKTAFYRFEQLMNRAQSLTKQMNIEGLKDLNKIILRPVQSNAIRSAYLSKDHDANESLFWNDSLGFNSIIPILNKQFVDIVWSDCLVKDRSIYPVLNLASDITLPTSWHPNSLIANLGSIGANLPRGEFKQSSNHQVMYSYPLGIGWVGNGNHSISQAIIRGSGEVVPEEVHDLTRLIEVIRFDGVSWRCIESNISLGKPWYFEFGCSWEIGRLIMELEESPYAEALMKQRISNS